MDNQQKLRGMIEGAILGAVWIILLFLTVYTPAFFITMFLLPAPLTILTFRRGIKTAMTSAFVVVILSVLFNLFVTGFGLVLYSIVVGLVTGYCLHNKRNSRVTFVATGLAVLVSNLLSLFFLSVLADYNMITELTQTMKESFAMSESIMAEFGVPPTFDENYLETMVELLRLMLPSIMIAASAIIAYIYYQFISYMMKRLGETVPGLPSFASFSLPRSILWYYVFATIGMLIVSADKQTSGFLYMLLFNIVQILMLVLALQGMSVVWYHMKKMKWSKIVRIPLLLILFHPLLLQIMTWVGMFDMFFNWRKLPKKS